MNPAIAKLQHITQKHERLIIGLMSGTSLDGLDIALCQISGAGHASKIKLLHFITMPFESDFRNRIRTIFAKRTIDQQVFSGLHAQIGQVHAQLVLKALDEWGIAPENIDCIASHGQTVYHAPISLTHDKTYPNSTLQIGDGDHIAVKTGIITLSDFRQKHIAAGGEGAPLAAYGDYLLFGHPTETRILLNIGGISNFTYIPSKDLNQQTYATDLGPGNTLMNQYMHMHYGKEMDENAETASLGKINQLLLKQLMEEPFLKLDFPKTTGPELFNIKYFEEILAKTELSSLSPEDIMATLNAFTAQSITQAIHRAIQSIKNFKIYVSGGGLHNPLLMKQLKEAFPHALLSFEHLGINPDAKEACLFAILANETLVGSPANVTQIHNAPAVCMGKISLPY